MNGNTLQLDHFLPYRLSIASNMVSDAISRSYGKMFGLNVPEWRLIAVIAEADSLTQQEIGVRTHMDKVTVSRAAIALTNRGLIVREPNAKDGRSHRLSLSNTGRQLYHQVVPKAIELEQRIFGAFSPDALKSFSAMLQRITAAAEDIL